MGDCLLPRVLHLQPSRSRPHWWVVGVYSTQPQPKVRRTFQQKYWRAIFAFSFFSFLSPSRKLEVCFLALRV